MKSQQELLASISKQLERQSCLLCSKLDQVIASNGATPVLYNTANSTKIVAGGTYSLPANMHSFTITVLPTTAGTNFVNVSFNGSGISYPEGYSTSFTASTIFTAGIFQVLNTSTADIIINTIS